MLATPIDVLLVEDNVDHAELVKRNFRQHSQIGRIQHVEDGEAALAYLFRRGEFSLRTPATVPHLILLDLRMPKVDGLEVLRQIKESDQLQRIPVVILTTSDAEADTARAYDLSANGYVVKPLDCDLFHSLIHDLGVYWLTRNLPADSEPIVSGECGPIEAKSSHELIETSDTLDR